MTFRTRFAPSPTGPLHLGHAYSAMLASDMAKAQAGSFLLRIEDTDTQRCKPHWEAKIYDDLKWLGLSWPEPVLRQSDHLARYDRALEQLSARGLVYPCSCTRSDIRLALSAPQEGDQPILYPGTCRGRPLSDRKQNDALRLNLAAALKEITAPLEFEETGPDGLDSGLSGHAYLQEHVGDAVLGRKDIQTVSYVLGATLDDAYQEITHVIRGGDLREFTFVQVLLQRLLDLPTPIYHHHRLIRDDDGKRLAKRDAARAISKFRDDGFRPDELRQMVGL